MQKSLLTRAITSTLSLSAVAVEYYVVVPVKGRTAPTPVETISVSLSAATLTAARVGKAYTYNLKDHLQVTGDPALDLSQATLATTDALPQGLSLASDGVLSGTPTVKNEAGSIYQVTATYKTKTGQNAYTIVVTGAVLEVLQISTGQLHTCAVTMSGGVKCWGWDGYGQLGNDTALTNQATPVDVAGLQTGVARISVGGGHTCAVTSAGGAKCWGYNSNGQLGDGTTTNRTTPMDVVGLPGVTNISTGDLHTCAVTTAGAALCWGADNNGQLGNDAVLTNRHTPAYVAGLTAGVRSISAGQAATCAVTTAGGARCWGADSVGQLGNDASLTDQPTPVTVSGLATGVASVSVGLGHTCAVTTSGGVLCWGLDNKGQLGNDAALINQSTPVDVWGLTTGVASISTGYFSTCVVTTTGGALCWGADNHGELGNDAALIDQPTPVAVAGLTAGVASISAGGYHTCMASTSGEAKCWGFDNAGQLGNDAALTGQPRPVDVVP